MQKEKSVFQIMSTAITKQEFPPEQDISKINSFLMLRWLSNHPIGVEVAHYLNGSEGIPIRNQYLFVRYTMPPKVKFINYPKSEKDDDSIIDVLVLHYKINRQTAKEYLKVISEEQLKRLVKAYTNIEGRSK